MSSTSASSSSHLIPTSSSSHSWNHDVFLSFRGEDTRKTFVAHLYMALKQQGICTYKDDITLPRGDVIAPSLLKAIRESQVAVVVLSENYADSSWCLDELAYIMECKQEIGQIVMPVFYDVAPSDVRKQNGKYGEALVKFELDKNDKVESWRKALTNVGNLSGWVPKNIANGDEAECIKIIVDQIMSMLSPLISKVSKDLVGIRTRLHDLKSKLEIGIGDVRIVGIWGVGGSGKTTLASSVYTEISPQFQYKCFLENVREETRNHGLKELQKKLLSHIWKTESPVVESVEGGRAMIERSLCHKKVLVVLDDVDNNDQLEALVGSRDWLGEGSRLIITTRDKDVLTRTGVIYSVSLLSHTEAAELFRRHAYREGKPVEDYSTLSHDVISYCNGLPLALKILGSFLYNKEKDQWISALAKLRDVPDSRVMDKLRISYDGLTPLEKELFLDIACLFCQKNVDFVMPILDAFGFHPVIELKVLEQKSLITISNGRFVMHDLIQEMAYYIVRGEPPHHPEEHTRVWRREDVENLCATGTTKENHNIEALSLDLHDQHPRLLQVAANMKNLRYLFWKPPIWQNLHNKSPLPKEFQPTKLVCLVLRHGSQKQLWEGCKHLPNLKILDLSYSRQLIRTPDFKGLPRIERLILNSCEGLKEIHPSIGHLERLVLLDMFGCITFKRFPPITRMKKLKTLNLSSCKSLKKFPKIRASMDSLVVLCLDDTAIEIIPSSIGKYCTNLVYLTLRSCGNLKRIEGNFQLLKQLKTLNLGDCRQLKELTEDFFDVECCLEVLVLSYTYSEQGYCEEEASVSFMNCFGFSHRDSFSMRFPQSPFFLKKLILGKLGDGDISSGVFELLNLQVLDLSYNDFPRLPSLSGLRGLKKLDLSKCRALVQLPDLPSGISVLKAYACDSLEQVGDLSKYKCLWNVSFYGCEKLVGWKSVVISLLQETVIRDNFMSVTFPYVWWHRYVHLQDKHTLQLPENWYINFSGFLLCLGKDGFWNVACSIIIKQEETCLVKSSPDEWKEFDKNVYERAIYGRVGYVPFASLSHTSWWNSEYTNLSFSGPNIKVSLVPKSKGGLMENAKAPIDRWEIWGSKQTFRIINDSNFSIEIKWDS